MPAPPSPPIGLHLARTAKRVARAFDEALAAVGGAAATWQVLLALKTRDAANQRELALAIGIRDATLTHHLNAMEAEGLLERRRDEANRRVFRVALTGAGEAAFRRLRRAAQAFDARLRAGFEERELDALRAALDRLSANAGTAPDAWRPGGGSLPSSLDHGHERGPR